MAKPSDLIIENKYGYICIEYSTLKGIVIYMEAKKVEGVPEGHMKFTEQETLKIGKWIAQWLAQPKE